MQPELKKELDKEIIRHRLSNLKVVLIIALLLASSIVFFGSFVNDEKTIVCGIVVSLHANVHDEGHDLVMMVEIPDRASLVRVKIPKSSNIKAGSKVELTRKTSILFNISRYRFFKYVG